MKKREKQICMSCLCEFDDKDFYWVTKIDHQVLHCTECLKNSGIEKYVPYSKPRKRKTKE